MRSGFILLTRTVWLFQIKKCGKSLTQFYCKVLEQTVASMGNQFRSKNLVFFHILGCFAKKKK